MVTFDTYLAVESGFVVPNSYSMSMFSYFPDFSTAECERHGVINDESFIRDLCDPQTTIVAICTNKAGDIQCGGWELGCSDQARAILAKNWVMEYRQETFGQWQTDLEVHMRHGSGKL